MKQQVISGRRLAANRANAALSTGPRTLAGKAASSHNAVSHGLTASKLAIFHWESQEEYAQLRGDYFTRFCPIDTSESDVIDRLVDSTWRRRRALVIETTLFDMEISATQDETVKNYGDSACGPLHLAIAFKNRHGEGVWDAILRLINSVDCAYSRALRDLEKLQGDRFNILPSGYLNPSDSDDPHAEPEPDPEPDPKPVTPPPALSSHNKIIEIAKQTQATTTASTSAPTFAPRNGKCKNEPIAISLSTPVAQSEAGDDHQPDAPNGGSDAH